MQRRLPLERTEYHACIGIALELGKSLDEARKEWQAVNAMQPIWCQIIKGYECECKKTQGSQA